MGEKKRPTVDIADLLIVLGVVLLLAGAYLIDWRLAMMVGGSLLIVFGVARLRRVERGVGQ